MNILFRLRFTALGVLAALAAAGVFFALHRQSVPVGAVFLSAISLAAAFAVAFVHLRDVSFAAVATVAPLPGMIAVGPFAIGHGLGIAALLAVYGLMTVAAALLSAQILRGIAASQERGEAALIAPIPLLLPISIAALAVCALAAGWLFQAALSVAEGITAEVLAGALSAVAFIAFGALVLPFSEAAMTQVNRARERREQRLRLATNVVEPRWGLSFCGITLVFLALGYFGAVAMLSGNALLARPSLWAASAFLVFLEAFAVSQDWREALASTLALVAATLMSLWLWGGAVGHLTAISFVEIATADAAAMVLMLVLLDRARRLRSEGDAPSVARLKALEDIAVPAFFGCAGAAAAILPWIVLHGAMATLAALFLLAGAASTISAPAIATALDTLVRRRESVEKLYGRG